MRRLAWIVAQLLANLTVNFIPKFRHEQFVNKNLSRDLRNNLSKQVILILCLDHVLVLMMIDSGSRPCMVDYGNQINFKKSRD